MESHATVFVFGDWELDVARGELRRAGTPVKLAPQPFKALHLLVSRAGALVTRDEMQQALWGGDSHVDFNAGLNFCIAQLRSTLEDPSVESRLIVSVPRRGYRFIAEVRTPSTAPAPAAIAAPAGPPLRRWWAAAAVVAFAAAAAQTPAADPLRIRVPASRSVAALKQYQLGVSGLADSAPADLPARVKRLESAIAEEPSFAEAYAALADARLIMGNYRVLPPQVAYAAAKAAAMKALSLDPALADAHAFYAASVMYLEWDWTMAGAHFTRAATLGTGSARAHQWQARYLSMRGRAPEAIDHARLAVAAAPRSASAVTDLGDAQWRAGSFAASAATCGDALALLPEYLPAQWCASSAALEAAQHPAAFWMARAERLSTTGSEPERMARAVAIAAAFAHAGRSDAALDWLERGANARLDTMLGVRVHPAFAALMREPRFAQILARIGA